MESMKDLATRAAPKYLEPSSAELSLARISGPRLSDDCVLLLGRMMAEMQADKPNQALAAGTADMWLAQWEEMAVKYGMETFRDGLSKALRENRFFPSPQDIGDHCKAIRREKREREDTLKALREQEEWKVQCKREAQEAKSNRPHWTPEQQQTIKRLNAILEAAHRNTRANKETV